jgi:predicted peptidase
MYRTAFSLATWLVGLAFVPAGLNTATAQQSNVKFEPREFVSGENKLLYQIHVPEPKEEKKQYPLIVYLHGAGGRGNDNKAQMGTDWYSTFINDGEEAILLAPQFPRGSRRSRDADRSQNIDSLGLLVQLLDQLEKKLSIDAQRRYLTGVSMGGGNTYRFLLRKPNYFAAAVPICGRFRPEEDMKPLTEPKLWIFHGDKDPAISVDNSRAAYKTIREAGGDVRYTEYPDVGHECWLKAYKDKNLATWLFEQRRG